MAKSPERPIEDDRYPGIVTAGCVLTLEEFRRRMRMTQSALKAARRHGLPLKKIGKRLFIMGEDFVEYARAQPDS